MEAKHTPGPWVFTDISRPSQDDGLGYIYEDGHSRGYGPTIAHTGSIEFDAETNRANARLIAAAPELYEACLQAEAHLIELYRGIAPQSDGRFADQDVSVLQIRAALAKARAQ